MFKNLIDGVLTTVNGWAKTGKDGCLYLAFAPLEGVAAYTLGEDHVVTGALNGVHNVAKGATDFVLDGATGLVQIVAPTVVDEVLKNTIGSAFGGGTDTVSTVVNVVLDQTVGSADDNTA
jgi:hypothetical protein